MDFFCSDEFCSESAKSILQMKEKWMNFIRETGTHKHMNMIFLLLLVFFCATFTCSTQFTANQNDPVHALFSLVDTQMVKWKKSVR